jgi:hypothetical protein
VPVPGAVQSAGSAAAVDGEQRVFTTAAAGGLPGAAAGIRLAGGTASGAPASGTFALRDVIADATGALWVCTAAGSPGTWAEISSAASVLAGATFTGYLAPAVVPLAFGASIAVNAALGNVFAVTLTASTGTLANPTGPVDGQVIRVRVIQGSGGSYTLAYGSAYDFGAAGAPVLSTAAGKADILGFEYVASLPKWCFLGSGLGF